MGAGIAAHLAAAGCKVHLLDLASKEGPTRSALAERALAQLPKAKPPALMSKQALTRLIAGNFEDDLARAIGESDLVIEAVVERLDLKLELWGKVAAHAAEDAILATNTSGIPLASIAAGLPAARRQASDFCDRALGKGIVVCRDTPNFIGNRIGIAEMLLTFRATQEFGFTIEEVDVLNGPLLGRPKTGTFRLGDLVGLDVIGHVVKNLEQGTSGDASAANYDPLHELMRVPEVVQKLVSEKRLGDKTGAGFYKKVRDPSGASTILALDLSTLEYRPQTSPDFPDLTKLGKNPDVRARVPLALRRDDRAGAFLRRVLVPLFNYAARLSGIICETPQQIDEAMRFGYGWQLGPFELLDAAGPAWVREQLVAAGEEPAPLLTALLEEGGPSATFYGGPVEEPTVFVARGQRQPTTAPEGAVLLDRLRKTNTFHQNPTARLIDIGDGVACLEFASKANVLDEGVVRMVAEAPRVAHERGFVGLVLGNQADHFCRGANLMQVAMLMTQKDYKGIEKVVSILQDAFMGLRHGPIPVVAAPIGQTLGGGTEAVLHCAEVEAGADLFLGLVEVGVGLLPAGGGLKEIARRASEWADLVPDQDPYPWVRRGFEQVAMAKVSSSAHEAREAGYLTPRDGITFHKLRVIENAKKRVLGLAARGWVPPSSDEPIRVIGEAGGANLMLGLRVFGWGGYASDYDQHIGRKIVHVLSGGMRPGAGRVTAQELLDLEREAFVSLCGEEKTQKRIEHMLTTKKPLRN
jgi:3-hydroxyacyl-CoA dehydrogenase